MNLHTPPTSSVNCLCCLKNFVYFYVILQYCTLTRKGKVWNFRKTVVMSAAHNMVHFFCVPA